MGRFLLFCALVLSDFLFCADIFHHELPAYPRGSSCSDTAADVAQSLSLAANVEIYWAGTSRENKTTCDLRISYTAMEPIKITSNVDRSGFSGVRNGTTRSLARCLADLPREVRVFKRNTGLEPWVAYCYQQTSGPNSFPFVPVVEALGEGAKTLFASSSVIGVTPNEGWQKTVSTIWRNALDQEISLASLTTRPYISVLDSELTVRYYARDRLYLRSEGIAEHTAPEICEQQINEIRQGIAKADRPPLAVYCGKYAEGQYRLGLIVLSRSIVGIGELKSTEDSKKFVTLEACRKDLPGIVEFYRAKLGKRALAGMCANSDGSFRVTVLSETDSTNITKTSGLR